MDYGGCIVLEQSGGLCNFYYFIIFIILIILLFLLFVFFELFRKLIE